MNGSGMGAMDAIFMVRLDPIEAFGSK